MPPQDTPQIASGPVSPPATGRRRDEARVIDLASRGRRAGTSVTRTARAEGVARSTLCYRMARKDRIPAPEALRDVFESPAGVALLHRVVAALHLVFVQQCACGVDRVGEFLRLSGLHVFAASSHGYHHGVARRVEGLLGAYGLAERTRLATGMTPRPIALCEDETFHPETCLVGIEPASGFIVLERYADARDAATWTAEMDQALAGLPVEVVVVSSDEAKGLRSHIRQGLGAEPSPDLFHVQHDLSRATARPMARRIDGPTAAHAQAVQVTADARKAKADYWDNPRPPGRPPLFDRYIGLAEQAEKAAEQALDTVIAEREAVRSAIRGVGDAFHLFDPATGKRQNPARCLARIRAAFQTIDAAAQTACSEPSLERIDKARRVAPRLALSLDFAQRRLDRALAALDLAPAIRAAVYTTLAPARYLERAARCARSAAERGAIRTIAAHRLAAASAPNSPLATLDPAVRDAIECALTTCFDSFVRSTACVEGRNGQLALQHHSLHRLSTSRLAALTVLHNFHIRRSDGTTAAQRFFGQAPTPLFEWLLERLEPPARPRASRQRRAA